MNGASYNRLYEWIVDYCHGHCSVFQALPTAVSLPRQELRPRSDWLLLSHHTSHNSRHWSADTAPARGCDS